MVNYHMLSSWLSQEDFATMIEAVFCAPVLGCPAIWDASANDAGWWGKPDDSAVRFQGGVFVDNPIFREKNQ